MAGVLAQRRAKGTGVLFSSHQLELVERLCDRVVIVRAGRIVADGTLDELRSRGAKQELEVIVDAEPSWLPRTARVLSANGRTYVLALDDPDDDQMVLAAASAAGRVERFGWRRPSLAELYREAVSE
jgi:ABC-2 type transport system ATP-binding protein